MIALDQFRACTGANAERAARWFQPMVDAMARFEIDNPLRITAFLANIAHECGSFQWPAEIWGPTEAQKGYEGRKDLGNLRPGDGKRFLGRGPLQVTGRSNAMLTRDQLRAAGLAAPDFEQMPELLETERWGSYSAANFWRRHGINDYADREDFDGACDCVNRGRKTSRVGDSNGYVDRLKFYRAGRAAYNLPEYPDA